MKKKNQSCNREGLWESKIQCSIVFIFNHLIWLEEWRINAYSFIHYFLNGELCCFFAGAFCANSPRSQRVDQHLPHDEAVRQNLAEVRCLDADRWVSPSFNFSFHSCFGDTEVWKKKLHAGFFQPLCSLLHFFFLLFLVFCTYFVSPFVHDFAFPLFSFCFFFHGTWCGGKSTCAKPLQKITLVCTRKTQPKNI